MPRQHVENTKEFWSENEAKRANKHAHKRIIYWPPFWNKVYCGCAQLRDKCSRRKIAKALFIKSGKYISLTIFDDELLTLHSIYKPNAKVEDSSNFIEENVPNSSYL